MAERDRLILVIDEYPYLAKAEPMVSSLLQQLIDHIMEQASSCSSSPGRV